jgi:hypothetical protein
MPHMLGMPALELGHPVLFLVLMKPGDTALGNHRRSRMLSAARLADGWIS